MKIKNIFYTLSLLTGLVFPCFVTASESVGSISNSYKYAWGENLGWINFAPDYGGLTITDTLVTGYAWSKDYGWINFSPSNFGGVTNDCSGVLGGNAWSSEMGWIGMAGVSISASGIFTGIAGTVGSDAGRINFSCLNCDVRTDWRPCASRATVTPPGGGGSTDTPPPETPPDTPPEIPPETPPEIPPEIPPEVPPEEPPPPAEDVPVEEPLPGEEPTEPSEPLPPAEVPPDSTPGEQPPGSTSESGQPSPEGATPAPTGESSGGSSGVGQILSNSPATEPETATHAPTETFSESINNMTETVSDIAKTIASPKINTIDKISKTVTIAPAIERVLIAGMESTAKTIEEPAVQQSVIPTVGAVAVINVASSAGYINLLNYIFYLFTQPLLLFRKRKYEKYGVVFNSLNKLPVDLAAIRIKNSEGKIIQTKISDRFGRYSFLIPKGNYELDITKPGYIFPTSILIGRLNDEVYGDILTSSELNYEKDTAVTNNIPIDPKEDISSPEKIKRRKLLRSIQTGAGLATTAMSIGAAILVPNFFYLSLAAFQLFVLFIFYRLSYVKRPASFGTTIDTASGKPVKDVVIRIMDNKFNRVLETQITDAEGRYAFLVGRGIFYITAIKNGFIPFRSEPIDCTTAQGSILIDKKLELVRAESQG